MAFLALKRSIARAWSLLPVEQPRRVILLYHSVDGGPWSLDGQAFRQQMSWLARQASVASLEDLLERSPTAQLEVAITFDDGYSSVARGAEPVLRDLGFPAAVYLNSGWISDGKPRSSDSSQGHYPGETFMTWQEVGALRARGWTIGSHGVDHLDLTRLDPAGVDAQLRGSRQTIETRLDAPCTHFAYTWGRYIRRTQEAVARAGYRSAASAIHGPVRAIRDEFALWRIDVTQHYTQDDFRAAVLGDWDYLGWIQRARRASGLVVDTLRP